MNVFVSHDSAWSVVAQGRRWAGNMTVKFNAVKGVEYQGSIYDARPTFESYGVSHGDRAGLSLKRSFIFNPLHRCLSTPDANSIQVLMFYVNFLAV